MDGYPKPLAATRRLAKHKTRSASKTAEDRHKGEARRRDGYRCRFPLCGCRRLGLRLEVSHLAHKGAGGNPSGSRSTTAGLILMCVQRHQDGAVSVHKGTLRVRPLTRKGCNGPVAWELPLEVTDAIMSRLLRTKGVPPIRPSWVTVACESAPGRLEPLFSWQEMVLCDLGRMEQ